MTDCLAAFDWPSFFAGVAATYVVCIAIFVGVVR
jgi:hypothetical protein